MEKIIEQIQGFFKIALPKAGIVLAILVFGYLLTKIVAYLCRKGLDRTGIDKSLESFFLRIIKIICYIIIIISALSELNISTTGLVASFSAAAAAVALALKDRLSDVASGIVILFTQPFVTGDYIGFADYQGEVQKIDLVHTMIHTRDGKMIMVPNSNLAACEVTNFTRDPQIRLELTVPVGYGADVEKVKSVIIDAVKKCDEVLRDDNFEPIARLKEFGASSLDFTVKYWVDFDGYWTAPANVIESIKIALDKNDIPIPYNQLDVHMCE
jgi:small conductance mechanosensitive channel